MISVKTPVHKRADHPSYPIALPECFRTPGEWLSPLPGVINMSRNVPGRPRIWIVAEQGSDLAALEALLQRSGYVTRRSVGRPAELAEDRRAFRPDLVLLDLAAIPLTDLDAIAWLRPAAPPKVLPVLALLPEDDQETMRRAFDAGVENFLSRPLDEGEILRR